MKLLLRDNLKIVYPENFLLCRMMIWSSVCVRYAEISRILSADKCVSQKMSYVRFLICAL